MSRQAAGAQREVHTPDMPVRELAPIENPQDRTADIIVASEKELESKDYNDELAFNQDRLVIVLHKGREKFAPMFIDAWVNGRAIRVPVDTKVRLPRCYVEVLARAQQMDVQTESHAIEDDHGAGTVNRILRSLSANYPFSVLEDPSPKGAAWLSKVMREN